MAEFAANRNEPVRIEEVTCGTVCCALGKSVVVFPEQTAKFSQRHTFRVLRDQWYYLGEHLYGEIEFEHWEWLFSNQWYKVDNTPLGVAIRIRFFIKYGVPTWFRWEDLGGEQSLTKKYKEWKRERQARSRVKVG